MVIASVLFMFSAIIAVSVSIGAARISLDASFIGFCIILAAASITAQIAKAKH